MKTQKSFTLVEVLVAIWIIGTTLVAIVGLNIGNINLSKNIDEISQAILISYDATMRGYLQSKYNAEIPPIEYPENFQVDTQVMELPSSVLLGNINLPPIPLTIVKTPSGKTFEIIGTLGPAKEGSKRKFP